VRVLHVVPSISAKYGSQGNVTTFLRYLAKFGVDATLLTTNMDLGGRLDVPLNQPVMRDGARCIFHNVISIGGRYGLAPGMVTTLRRTVRTYDLVHIHWLYDFSSIAAARAAMSAGVPFVVQPHGSLDPHLFKKNRLIKRLYLGTVGRPLLTRASAVIFTAEEERRLAVDSHRRPEWIVPVGLDASRFERLPAPGTFRAAFPAIGGPFLLFLGRLSAQKGLDLLLTAFQRLLPSHPELWLVIAGPDYRGYEAEVRAMTRSLGLEHRVVFSGLLGHDAKLAAFVDAERFVLPSYAENFGVVITEALACGLPVVISDKVNIHRELADAGVATVVQCTVESVAAGVQASLADDDLRRRMKTLGPAVVGARYTLDAIVPMLIEKYKEPIAMYPPRHVPAPPPKGPMNG
jgi:glycosyltransferase involved in cell wall biosynthesis